MIIGFAALIVLAALFFTLRISPKSLPPLDAESPVQPLEEAKVRIYENLRDLQFEYRLNKITDEDYQTSKLDLQKELARVLAQMEALGAKPKAAAKAPALYTCPHCGAEFKEKLKFCGECGKAMA
ncbi:MAG: zinc ribbon domain-containing protein [Acidobacteria bacterium]|nr:zinc ribbon domain-containing protein [Acidobacteriota bacterium]